LSASAASGELAAARARVVGCVYPSEVRQRSSDVSASTAEKLGERPTSPLRHRSSEKAPSAYLEERDSVSTREERRCVEIMRAAF